MEDLDTVQVMSLRRLLEARIPEMTDIFCVLLRFVRGCVQQLNRLPASPISISQIREILYEDTQSWQLSR
jgi:hypothetical protein